MAIIFVFFSLISALAFDAPIATPVYKGFELEAQGWSPRPTEPPSMEELIRRQQALSDLILAPDGTCGYVSGSSASPFGLCCNTCTCGFQTTPHAYGKFFCCNTDTCESRTPTTCVDGIGFSTLSICDTVCVSDSSTLKCTAAPYTYCNLAEFEGVTVRALFCDSSTVRRVQSMFTTYAGQIGRVFSVFTGFNTTTSTTSTESSSSSSISSSSSSSSSTSSSSPSTISSTTSAPSPTTPTTPVIVGGQTSTVPTSVQASTTSDASTSLPLGAIIGGSIGGFAFLALISIGVVFLIRHPKPASNSIPDSNKLPVGFVDGANGPPGGPQGPNPVVNMAYVPPGPPAGYAIQQQPLQGTIDSYYPPSKLPPAPPQQASGLVMYPQQAYISQPQGTAPHRPLDGGTYLPSSQQQWSPQQLANSNQQLQDQGTTYAQPAAGQMPGQAQTQQVHPTGPQYNQRLSELSAMGSNVQDQSPAYQPYQPQFMELNASLSSVAGPDQPPGLGQMPVLGPKLGATAAAIRGQTMPGHPVGTYTNSNLVPAPLNVSGTNTLSGSPAGAIRTGAEAGGATTTAAEGNDTVGAVPGTDASALGSVPQSARMSSPYELNFDGYVP